MNENELIQAIENLDTDTIKFAVTDIDGVLRGKTINRKKWLKGIKEGIGFCNVIFGWDMNDACYDNTEISGWHTAYPDAKATLDLNTFRRIPWNNDMPFFDMSSIATFGGKDTWFVDGIHGTDRMYLAMLVYMIKHTDVLNGSVSLQMLEEMMQKNKGDALSL